MDRRNLTHVSLLLAAGILARIIMFDYVGIWGDMGFYVYNSRLILEGQTPFIDFLGRSPLFIYPYAGLRGLIGHPVALVRSYIIAWWLLAAIPVYLIAEEIHSHRAGLAALAIYLLSPFAIGYGMWANTQSMAAFFATTAILLIIKTDTTRAYTAAGVLLGLAFLARRSIIVILPAIALYLTYTTLRHDRHPTSALTQYTGTTVAFAGTLFVGYLAVVNWRPELAIALYETHAVNLFLSTGRGGYPLLGTTAPDVTNTITRGRIPIFNDLCQMCGRWTARTFAKTLLVTIPIVGPLALYFRDLSDHYYTTAQVQYFYGILGALALYATARAALAGYYIRVTAVLAIVLYGILAYKTTAPRRQTLYHKHIVLLLLVLGGFGAGYLYRNRLIHTYYFMDFLPLLAVLAGILYIELDRGLSIPWRRVLVVTIVLASVTTMAGAYPAHVGFQDEYENGWFTMSNIEDYQADLNERTEPGEVVFTAHPNFVMGTHARMVNDNVRIHYLYATFENTGPSAPMYENLREGFTSGRIRYVIVGGNTQNMLEYDKETADVFEAHYCRVPEADSLYQRTDRYLYKWTPDASSCPSGTQVNVETMFGEPPRNESGT